jgi:hypothetical protein
MITRKHVSPQLATKQYRVIDKYVSEEIVNISSKNVFKYDKSYGF